MRIVARVLQRGAVRLVVFFLGAVPKVDLAGAELLTDLYDRLGARGIDVRLADAHGEVREALRRIHFEKQDLLETGRSVDVVISAWQSSKGQARR